MKMHGPRYYLEDPHFMEKFHWTAMVIWLLLAIPSITTWKESIPWLVFISVYAIVVGHWGGAQAAGAQKEARDDTVCVRCGPRE